MTSTKFVLHDRAEWARMAEPLPSDRILLLAEHERRVHPEWESGGGGLVTTITDYARFAQMLLNGGVYAHHRILQRATIAQFTTPQQLSGGARTLGWAVPTEGSSSGHFFSAHSFGHTGYTGTSIWIDPDRQLFVVLLTNRVHPTRENQKIAKVRPALHDAVMEALGFATATVPAQ